MKKILIIVGIVALVGLGGLGWYYFSEDSDAPQSQTQTTQSTEQTAVQISDDGRLVAYDGVVGETALESLKRLTVVETKSYDFGEQVIAINGLTASDSEFWSFYVNDQMASVGAGSYNSVAGDKIEWKLEIF